MRVTAGDFANRQLSQNGQSFIPGRLSGCSDWTLDVRNVRNKFAPFARIFAVVDSRYVHPAVQITSRIRGSLRTTSLVPSPFFSPLPLPFSISISLLRARSLSIPLPFPGSVCTASINIYNKTRSSDCTPLPIWPESLANAPVILGRLPAIFTKRGHWTNVRMRKVAFTAPMCFMELLRWLPSVLLKGTEWSHLDTLLQDS